MKKTYKNKLPKGMKPEKVTAIVENGHVIVDVEFKEEFSPKDGDFLVDKDGDIFIYNGKETKFSYGCYICESNKVVCIESADNWVGKEGCMYASEKEKNEFLARLEEQYNVRWNQEKKETEKIRWRAGIGEKYYFISDSLKVISDADLYTSEDDNRYKVCNYFRKRESAIIISERIKEIFRNSESKWKL